MLFLLAWTGWLTLNSHIIAIFGDQRPRAVFQVGIPIILPFFGLSAVVYLFLIIKANKI